MDHTAEYNIHSSGQFEQDHHHQQQHHHYIATTPQYHNPYANHIITGIVPPQQVYVQQQQHQQLLRQQQAQLPLETQFQSLGLGPDSSNHVLGENNNSHNTDCSGIGEAKEIVNGNDELKVADGIANAEENINSIGGEGDANEENESEEEPIKLFVGQVRERNYCTVDV
jgi:hypothetical protein